jgi:hypothetical protein
MGFGFVCGEPPRPLKITTERSLLAVKRVEGNETDADAILPSTCQERIAGDMR